MKAQVEALNEQMQRPEVQEQMKEVQSLMQDKTFADKVEKLRVRILPCILCLNCLQGLQRVWNLCMPIFFKAAVQSCWTEYRMIANHTAACTLDKAGRCINLLVPDALLMAHSNFLTDTPGRPRAEALL